MDVRVIYLLIGCLIGFVLGYQTKTIRELRDRVDEVDEHVLQGRTSSDSGFAKNGLITNVALAIVVALVAVSSFYSQSASNHVKEVQAQSQVTQRRVDKVSVCNQKFLKKTISALNARTAYSVEQTSANLELQKAQLKYLQVYFQKIPATTADRQAALAAYLDSLTEFIKVNGKTSNAITTHSYPTNTEFETCVNQK